MLSVRYDSERKSLEANGQTAIRDMECGNVEKSTASTVWQKMASFLGVEMQGSEPISPQQQTERQYFKLFTLWFSMNFNLIAVSTGMTGTLSYGLGLRDCSLVILFFGLLTALAAPYLSLYGSMLGLRQMIHARYAFGLYGAAVPLILNMATLAGYSIVDCILGGQALAAINPGNLSVNVGIVIIAIINLAIVVCGARVIHQFDSFAWFPTLVGILVAVGCGGKYLHLQSEAEPAEASTALSFGSLIAGFFLPWCAIASDFTIYFDRESKKMAMLIPSYVGLVIGGVPLMILGAAIGGAVPNVPSWEEGYNENSIGGVFGAMLEPAEGFGKFTLVLLALSVLSNVAGTIYALTLNCQALLFLVRVRISRIYYIIGVTAIIISVAIKVASEFLTSLNNFLGIISYWPACFVAVSILEHLVIRRGKADNYALEKWNISSELPSGVAALSASVLSFGLVIPGMDQLWFVGPLAESTGDIGFEMGFAITIILYLPFRYAEIKIRGHI